MLLTLYIINDLRKKNIKYSLIEKYNLPDLKPGYFLSAMDRYLEYFKSTNISTTQVRFLYIKINLKYVCIKSQ